MFILIHFSFGVDEKLLSLSNLKKHDKFGLDPNNLDVMFPTNHESSLSPRMRSRVGLKHRYLQRSEKNLKGVVRCSVSFLHPTLTKLIVGKSWVTKNQYSLSVSDTGNLTFLCPSINQTVSLSQYIRKPVIIKIRNFSHDHSSQTSVRNG